MENNKIQKVTDFRLYYLTRPHLIANSITSFETRAKVFEEGKIIYKDILTNELFVKQIQELYQNSIDEFMRTKGEYANKISINIDRTSVEVKDNGRGIPIKDLLSATTEFHTSSNYEFMEGNTKDDSLALSGVNGIGSKLIPLLSTDFKCVSINPKKDSDGNNSAIVTARDNMEFKEVEYTKAPKGAKCGMTTTFTPDFKRMEMTEITDDLINHIHAMLIDVAYTNPNIEFSFNGKVIKCASFKEYLGYYVDKYLILDDNEKVSIAVYPSDGYEFVHIVNSLMIKDANSNALSYLTNTIIESFGNRLRKGYPKISNNYVKSKMGLIFVIKDVPASLMQFRNGQTKESLSTSWSNLKLPVLNASLKEAWAEKLFKFTALKQPIIELYQVMKEMEDRKNDTPVKADKKQPFNSKFLKPVKKHKYLCLLEGDSAGTSITSALGREEIGYVTLGGKPMNGIKATNRQLGASQKIIEVVNALGLGLDNQFENVVLACDNDADGTNIQALCLSILYKLAPAYLKENRVFFFKTPIIAVLKGNELFRWYYSIAEYEADRNNLPSGSAYTTNYLKGLGSLTISHYKTLIESEKAKSNEQYPLFVQLKWDDEAEETLMNWLSEEGIEFRKEILSKTSFDLNML